jgi:hypothetical protein
MTSFLDLLEIAAARGDGLHPKLRALCEGTASAPQCDTVTRIDGMIQSGPILWGSSTCEDRRCRSADRCRRATTKERPAA